MNDRVTIRDLRKEEIPYLDGFLYDAVFIPEGVVKPDKSIIRLPELSVYIQDFGRSNDICLVAEVGGVLAGAVWTRVFSETARGFGYVDSQTPELSMSVGEYYRGQGIGTRLLIDMLNRLSMNGYESVSLSVDCQNYAIRLYQKYGFVTVETDSNSATMIKSLH